jgi:hypothetical protein
VTSHRDKSKSKSVEVLCTDRRQKPKDKGKDENEYVIELGFNAANKFGSPPLKEPGRVCMGDKEEAELCHTEKDCDAHQSLFTHGSSGVPAWSLF